MEEKKKEEIDLSKLTPKEELSKIAEICKKLNYIFNNNESVKESLEEPVLTKKGKMQL